MPVDAAETTSTTAVLEISVDSKDNNVHIKQSKKQIKN